MNFLPAAGSARLLDSRDSLVLQHPHDYAAVLGLSFGALIVPHLVRRSQGAGRQKTSKRNVSLLQQDVGHVAGAVFTQFLVQRCAARNRRIAFHLDHVTVNTLGFLCQRQQLCIVLGINFGFPLPKYTVTSSQM